MELIDANTINIDNWIKFEMDGKQASQICALREFIDQLVINASNDPEEIINFKPAEMNAIQLISDLCVMGAGDYLLSRTAPQTYDRMDGGGPNHFTQSESQTFNIGFSGPGSSSKLNLEGEGDAPKRPDTDYSERPSQSIGRGFGRGAYNRGGYNNHRMGRGGGYNSYNRERGYDSFYGGKRGRYQ